MRRVREREKSERGREKEKRESWPRGFRQPSSLTYGSVGGGEVVDENFGRGGEERLDVDVGVEGAEIVIPKTARDADRGQNTRALALAQNHGIFEILFVGRFEGPTLGRLRCGNDAAPMSFECGSIYGASIWVYWVY